MGRIYRVLPQDKKPRPWQRLDKLDAAELVAALNSPNGWQRDMASQLLLWKPAKDRAAVKPLEDLLTSPLLRSRGKDAGGQAAATRPEARLHALCVLGALDKLRPELLHKALADAHPGVRRQAVRLTESLAVWPGHLSAALLARVNDPDAQVRLQLAFTLGSLADQTLAGLALGPLASAYADDPYLSAAVLSSLSSNNVDEVLASVLTFSAKPPPHLVRKLFGLATALKEGKELSALLEKATQAGDDGFAAWQLAALAGVLDELDRRKQGGEDALKEGKELLAFARKTVADVTVAETERLAAVALLGREPSQKAGDTALLKDALAPRSSPAVQAAAVAALGRLADEGVPAAALAGWKSHAPSLKGQILDLLLSRPAWQRQLLTALEKNEVPVAQIDLPRRQRLLGHKDQAVRAVAAKVFAGSSNPDRRKVLKEYEDALTLTGDRLRGKAVFAKACAACHRQDGAGHAVGPDLDQAAGKSALYLLTEILDPNKNVDSRYIEYQAVLKDGRVLTGLLATETATSITLRAQEAKEAVILRADVDELRSTGKSLMPEGMERDLSRQGLADVIAYLMASAPPK
jgi:putative heme-binding domain-containing protein